MIYSWLYMVAAIIITDSTTLIQTTG